MAITETLSVRLDPQTRQILDRAAQTDDAAGASGLARQILERWAARQVASEIQASIGRAVSYLQEHPEGWDDDPEDFFPGTKP